MVSQHDSAQHVGWMDESNINQRVETSCLPPVANSVRRPTANPNITHRPLLISLAFVHPKNLQQGPGLGQPRQCASLLQSSQHAGHCKKAQSGSAQPGQFVGKAVMYDPSDHQQH